MKKFSLAIPLTIFPLFTQANHGVEAVGEAIMLLALLAITIFLVVLTVIHLRLKKKTVFPGWFWFSCNALMGTICLKQVSNFTTLMLIPAVLLLSLALLALLKLVKHSKQK